MTGLCCRPGSLLDRRQSLVRLAHILDQRQHSTGAAFDAGVVREVGFGIAAMGAAVGVAGLGTSCARFRRRPPIRLRSSSFGGQVCLRSSSFGGQARRTRGREGRGHSNRKNRGYPPPGRARGDENAVLPAFDRVDINARAKACRRLHELRREANEASGLPDGARTSPMPARRRQRPRVFKALPRGRRASGHRAVEQPFGPAGEFFAMVCVQRHAAMIRPLRGPGIRFPKFVQLIDSSR